MMHDNAKEHQSLVPQTYVCKTNDTRCIKKEFALQLYKLVVSSHRKLIIPLIENIRQSKSSIVFCNNRSIIFKTKTSLNHKMKNCRPYWRKNLIEIEKKTRIGRMNIPYFCIAEIL